MLQIGVKLLEINSLKPNFLGKYGNNILEFHIIGWDYHSFSLLLFLRAAISDFMTSYGCSIDCDCDYDYYLVVILLHTKGVLLCENSGNQMTSQKPKWWRTGNSKVKIGDTLIQFHGTLNYHFHTFQTNSNVAYGCLQLFVVRLLKECKFPFNQVQIKQSKCFISLSGFIDILNSRA